MMRTHEFEWNGIAYEFVGETKVGLGIRLPDGTCLMVESVGESLPKQLSEVKEARLNLTQEQAQLLGFVFPEEVSR